MNIPSPVAQVQELKMRYWSCCFASSEQRLDCSWVHVRWTSTMRLWFKMENHSHMSESPTERRAAPVMSHPSSSSPSSVHKETASLQVFDAYNRRKTWLLVSIYVPRSSQLYSMQQTTVAPRRGIKPKIVSSTYNKPLINLMISCGIETSQESMQTAFAL